MYQLLLWERQRWSFYASRRRSWQGSVGRHLQMIRKILVTLSSLLALLVIILPMIFYPVGFGNSFWINERTVVYYSVGRGGTFGRKGYVELRFRVKIADPNPAPVAPDFPTRYRTLVRRKILCFNFNRSDAISRFGTHRTTIVDAPTYVLLVLFLIFSTYPTLVFFRGPFRRWRRRRKGRCVACGYDLQGSRRICPECGSENVAVE